MIKVSIIVPIYNVEQYLRRCVDSLLAQTLLDIEIILINDASPDHSHLIMQEYEKQYTPKVKCIYLKENLRLGGARNRGIDAANGEYVTFVDSDDSIKPTMCEKMYEKALVNNSDVVFCDYSFVWEETGKVRNKMMVYDAQMGDVTKEKLKSLLFAEHYAWAKLIRRNLILEHQIFFPEHKMYEDIPTTRFYLLYSRRIDKVNESFYRYYQRTASITHRVDATFQYEEAEMALMFYDECNKRGVAKEFQEEIKMVFAILFYLYPLNNCFDKFTTPPMEYMSYLKNKMMEIYPDYINNAYINKVVEPRLVLQAKANDISPNYLLELQHKEEYFDDSRHYLNYYNDCSDKIKDLFSYCQEKDFTIAVWGLGKKGSAFLDYCIINKYDIHAVIDKNEKLIGSRLDTGHTVQRLDEVINTPDIIFVMNKNFLYDIQREIHNENQDSIVFNLDGYLCYDITLIEWMKNDNGGEIDHG